MGKALYRKYRSRRLDEIVGQEHITKTLANALKNQAISHAYLLTGPKGVGKTSVARILAHEVNKLPYQDDNLPIDIIEIDAASNRRIDEIRDLRDKVHITPVSASYKVYIIDEVHMLTKEAFNALLKTLEEPPSHAIFILATTEAHKLPETIISRTQRFSFKPIEPTKLKQHLRQIAKAEKIDISDEALALIAEHGQGSFRDSIGLLDQARGISPKIELVDIQRLLGLAPARAIEHLYQVVCQGVPQQIIAELGDLQDAGYSSASLAKQLNIRARAGLLNGSSLLPPLRATKFMQDLLDSQASQDVDTALEIVLLTTNLRLNDSRQPDQAVAKTKVESPKELSPTALTPSSMAAKQTPKKLGKTNSLGSESLDQAWQQVLRTVKQQNTTLYGVLRMAQPAIEGQTLKLTFDFAFHQKRINEAKNKQAVATAVKTVFETPYEIECVVGKASSHSSAKSRSEARPPAATIETISNIFGGAEVLES